MELKELLIKLLENPDINDLDKIISKHDLISILSDMQESIISLKDEIEYLTNTYVEV